MRRHWIPATTPPVRGPTEPTPPHACRCGDEVRPGWVCSECGTRAEVYMTREQMAELEPLGDEW